MDDDDFEGLPASWRDTFDVEDDLGNIVDGLRPYGWATTRNGIDYDCRAQYEKAEANGLISPLLKAYLVNKKLVQGHDH